MPLRRALQLFGFTWDSAAAPEGVRRVWDTVFKAVQRPGSISDIWQALEGGKATALTPPMARKMLGPEWLAAPELCLHPLKVSAAAGCSSWFVPPCLLLPSCALIPCKGVM